MSSEEIDFRRSTLKRALDRFRDLSKEAILLDGVAAESKSKIYSLFTELQTEIITLIKESNKLMDEYAKASKENEKAIETSKKDEKQYESIRSQFEGKQKQRNEAFNAWRIQIGKMFEAYDKELKNIHQYMGNEQDIIDRIIDYENDEKNVKTARLDEISTYLATDAKDALILKVLKEK